MLVVVHNRDIQLVFQAGLNLETLRCLDILKVNTTESRGDRLDCLDEFLGILLVYLNSGTDNEPSNRLIRSIFPSRSFLAAAQTYIPLLCDIRNGVEENARIRSNQSELMKEFSLGTGYGTLIRLDSNGRELERVQFTDQSAVELINRIAGGKFVALPPIQRPEIKDPVKEKELMRAVKGLSGEQLDHLIAIAKGLNNKREI